MQVHMKSTMDRIMKRIFTLLPLAALLAACAPAPLHKENATAAELHSDTDQCASMARARLPAGDPSMSDAVSLEMEQAMRRQAFVRDCLRDKGWR
jgi:hypothetical protein